MKNQSGNIGVILSFVIVAGLIGFVIYSLMNKPIKVDPLEGIGAGEIKEQATVSEPVVKEENLLNKQKNMNPNTKILKNFNPVSLVSKLEKIDIVVGTGQEVKAGETVVAHYTGAVAATGAIFQSSKDFGDEGIPFSLNSVIKGWTDGIPGMKIGGTRRLIIPAEMAYGATPPPGSGIPANADLVFDVELIAINK